MRNGRIAIAVVLGAAAAAGCGDDAPNATPAPSAMTSADERYLDAVDLLDVQRRPAEARDAFRALADDESAAAAVRARSRIGLARAEALLGQRSAAETALRDVIAKSGDLPSVKADAQAGLAAAAGSSTRFVIGIVDLAEAQFLDLDTGGVFGAPETPLGGRAEVTRRGDEIVWLAQHDESREMDDALPWIADAPWSRVATDAGRAAWLQRLPAPRRAVFRFVVRLSGMGDPLPAPRDAFCVGAGDGIDVHFTADARYARYRVERRIGPDRAFEPKGEIAAPPFADRAAEASARHGYRITGITERGDEGLPATVQGSTKSRGVVTGSVELTGKGRRFDFIAERIVPSGGDLEFSGSAGGASAVSFLDAWGRVVLAAADGGTPRTVWAAPAKTDWPNQIRSGARFVVPLRGGGVARCRVTTTPHKTWHVKLDYEVDPDADAFAAGPKLEADERASDTLVRVVPGPGGFSVAKILARDPRTEDAAEELAVADGCVVDPKAGPGALREYVATGEDRFGRRSVSAALTVNRRAADPHEGTFQFHYQQGWSFELERVVDPAEADLVFSTCAGGISSITLTAPGGIVSLETAAGGDHSAPSAGRLFEMVLGADEKELKLAGSTRCDDRSPLSDVAVVRTRHGGWARVAITERGNEGGWTENLATVRFTYNPRAPLFASATEEPDVIGGLRLAPGAVPRNVGLGRGESRGPSTGPRVTSSGGAVVIESKDGLNLTREAIDEIKRLGSTKVAVDIAKQPFADVLKVLEVLGVSAEADPAVRGITASAQVEYKSADPVTLAVLLDALTKQAGVTWMVTEKGAVRIVPAPK